ncbi:MAG: hypothetical protein ACK559_22855, partial [bacterium]
MEAHPSTHPAGQRQRHLVDVHDQAIAIPAQLARADRERRAVAIDAGGRPLGHRPAPIGAVEGDVERAMRCGIVLPAQPRPPVVG